MIVFRYLIGEVFKSQLAVFLILITIILSQRFVKILADASEGELPGQLVLTLISLKLPQLAVLILPLAAFLGVLVAYSRIYAESEMTVLHATGISEWYVARLTLILSLGMALAAGGLMMYLSPWAAEREYQLLEKVSSDSGLSTLIPGRFQQTSNEKAVVFVHDISRDGHSLSKVFLAQQATEDGGQHSVVYAETGTVLEDSTGAQRLAALNHGTFRSPIPGREAQDVLRKCRDWASEIGEIPERPCSGRTRKRRWHGIPRRLSQISAKTTAALRQPCPRNPASDRSRSAS